MPPVDRRDLRRLADRVESTVGRSVDLPLDRLDSEESATDGMVRPVHRLLRHVDPTADEFETLRVAVEKLLAEQRAAGGPATDVAVAVNLLNLADIEVDRALVYAIDPDHGAVDEAIESLLGRVLFASEGSTYRTVHDAWSAAFLAALIDSDDDAAERVGRVVTRITSLADDPDHRRRVLDAIDDGRTRLDTIDDAPTDWADDVVSRVFGVGERWPKLAALFGDPGSEPVTLPDACSQSIAADCRLSRANAWYEAGRFENAAEEFEQLRAPSVLETLPSERARAYRAHAARGLGNSMIRLGELDRGRELLTEALATYRELDDRRRELDCLNGLGVIAATTGDHDEALERFRGCLTVSEEIGVIEGCPKYCNNLGTLHRQHGNLEDAERRLREALAYYDDWGEMRTSSACNTLNNLALVELYRCDFDTSEGYLAEALEVADAIGARVQRATSLTTKAHTLGRSGRYDAAAEAAHEAIELARSTGNDRKEATALYTAGRVAFHRGEFDDARAYATESLEIRRDIGERHTEADSRVLLGRTALRVGDREVAERQLRAAAERYAEIGDDHSGSEAELGLGELAVRRGDLEPARGRLSAARDGARACGDPFFENEARLGLGDIAAAREDYSTAVDRFSEAVEWARSTGAVPVATAAIERLIGIELVRENTDAAAEWCRTGSEITADIRPSAAEAFRERAESFAAETNRVGRGGASDAAGEFDLSTE